MARGGKRPGAGRKPKPRPPTADEVQSAADRAEGIGGNEDDGVTSGLRGRGRPSAFRAEYVAQAEKLCRLGATDAEMAAFFEVALSTLYRWKLDHSDFSEALKRGKALADDMVEQRLFQRAVGYSHDAVKIFQYEGQPVVVDFIEHYPPDTAAAFIWLKNRRPEKWRDKPLGEGGTPADLARDIEQARTAMAEVEGRDR